MKFSLVFFGIIAVIGVFFSFWFLLQSDPFTPVDEPQPLAPFPTGTGTLVAPDDQVRSSGIEPEVAAAFKKQARYAPDLTLDGTVIVDGYALQGWSDGNASGVAILLFTSDIGWRLFQQGGGWLSVGTLTGMQVPRSIAERLMDGLSR